MGSGDSCPLTGLLFESLKFFMFLLVTVRIKLFASHLDTDRPFFESPKRGPIVQALSDHATRSD